MSLYISDQNKVAFKYESGLYANPSGNAHWIGLVTDHSPSEEENVTSTRYVGTSSRNVAQQISTAKDYEGTVTYHPQDFKMFGFALGSTIDTSGTTSLHQIRELNSDGSYAYTSGTNHNFPSFTIVDSKKGQADGEHFVRTYKGCIADSLSLTASQGEPIECELSYIAQSLEVGSKTSDIPSISDEDTSRPYLWSDTSIQIPNGTSAKEVTEFSWSISNNSERRHYDNGSKVIENVTPLNRDYEVSITMDGNSTWASTFEEQYWQGGSTFNMFAEVKQNDSEFANFEMSGCKVTSFESPSPAEGVNEFSITIIPEEVAINGSDATAYYNPW